MNTDNKLAQALRELPQLWRQIEQSAEPQTEFDKGYEQASQECADALERLLAAHDAREGERDDLPGNCKRCERCSNIFVISELYFSNLCPSCIRAAQPQPSVAEGFLLVRKSDLIGQDSYGVHGSEFYYCRICGCESGAGMLNKGITHAEDCPLAAAPQPRRVKA